MRHPAKLPNILDLTHRWQGTTAKNIWYIDRIFTGCTSRISFGLHSFRHIFKWPFFLLDFTEVCNIVVDITFLAHEENLEPTKNRLGHESFLAIEWFRNNCMKSNQGKCHLVVAGFKCEKCLEKNQWSKNLGI